VPYIHSFTVLLCTYCICSSQSLIQLLNQQLPLKPSLAKAAVNPAAGGRLLGGSPGALEDALVFLRG